MIPLWERNVRLAIGGVILRGAGGPDFNVTAGSMLEVVCYFDERLKEWLSLETYFLNFALNGAVAEAPLQLSPWGAAGPLDGVAHGIPGPGYLLYAFGHHVRQGPSGPTGAVVDVVHSDDSKSISSVIEQIEVPDFSTGKNSWAKAFVHPHRVSSFDTLSCELSGPTGAANAINFPACSIAFKFRIENPERPVG